MAENKLIIACAGSGKTTHLVEKALSIQDENVLITTYTDANRDEIEEKFIEKNGSVPANVIIQTLVSFLLEHGVRPFQGMIHPDLAEVKIGYHLVEGTSGKYVSEEKNFMSHFFSTSNGVRIYSDKLSKFVVGANEKTEGEIIKRITSIYPHIFFDEVQDLAGWDLDLIKLFLQSEAGILLVGDPRQGTYSTNNANKSKQYRKSDIVNFFESKAIRESLDIDSKSLVINYRSCEQICSFSNQLFPEWTQSVSGKEETSLLDGVYVVREKDIDKFLENRPRCMLLRESARKKVDRKMPIMTFGKSKGLAFEHVLIYPTQPIIKWLKNHKDELKPTSKSKFYVALTRAESSVGIVYDFKDDEEISGIDKYYPTQTE